MNSSDLEKLQGELKWVHMKEQRDLSFLEKLKSKGIAGFLVPAGCLVTAGVLLSGIYQLTQKNSQKQQALMRYRVAAQGFTVIVAMFGMLSLPFTQSKSQ